MRTDPTPPPPKTPESHGQRRPRSKDCRHGCQRNPALKGTEERSWSPGDPGEVLIHGPNPGEVALPWKLLSQVYQDPPEEKPGGEASLVLAHSVRSQERRPDSALC